MHPVLGPRSSALGRDPPEHERASDDQHRAERDWNALDTDGHAEQFVERRDDPVAENGFVEARQVVERRIDVVVRVDHLARRFDVERLVRVPDGDAAQRNEIDGERERQQNGQRDPARSAGRGWLSDGNDVAP